MAREGFGTDPTGMLARGAPGASGNRGGAGVSVGRVGIPMGTIFPGVTAGTGVGTTLKVPIGAGSLVKKHAKGGKVKKMAKGGSTASKRADGCAKKGKTKGRMV